MTSGPVLAGDSLSGNPASQMPITTLPVMNLGTLLTQTARKYPDLPGFIQGDSQRSWSEINARVDALAHHLTSLEIGRAHV